MLRVYVPGATVFVTVTLSSARPSEPGATVTLFGMIETVGPTGEEETPRSTVPAKEFRLGTRTVTVRSMSPLETSRLPALGTRSKYIWLLNLAVCEVSGSGIPFPAPLETVTQTPPATLVPVQPVWNVIGVLAEFATTVKFAVNKRSVTGLLGVRDPETE